ncbi:alpha-galactosidase [Rariglobus hedericola]|uniref:Alpha-galactosidase n=1 Tax=Rariglobus hedericola TaxID=2597822 RepID=A0A556QK78_9BACT|nr:alpha-galactosidase [Rariglobus hedericola]TSJ77050.1 alpha-galactosidase [Rariglobus hedericola]
MAIHFIEAQSLFILQAGASTYAIKVTEHGFPINLYWGPALAASALGLDNVRLRDRAFSPTLAGANQGVSLDTLPLEFPTFGNSDFREPALDVYQPQTGSRILSLRYDSHRIEAGKPALAGLPSTFVETPADADTLTLVLIDALLGLRVELLYTVFANHPVITRSVRIVNAGTAPLEVRRALSASIDFDSSFANHRFIQLSGAWARERDTHISALRPGVQSVESRRGTSSHQQSPFIALAELGANEEHGSVYGFNLVYSGNFLAQVELDPFSTARTQIGINPFDFAWQLGAGDTFQTPEAVLVFSPEGLGGMSRALHRFYRSHLLPVAWRDKPRPILVNNWEATYFDFNATKLEAIATAGAELGVELFVLDDGWFGKRDDDRTSLGDWVVDRKKLPGGLNDLARRIKAKGVEFGLWFEPEMVSVDSDLYRAHPDWCIHVPQRPRTEGRQQLILDFSRAEVREEIYQRIAQILRDTPITYVKWDMNRHMTETGSAALPAGRQQETAHRYVLGLYEIMERFTREFPHILFEGCSGGGGRFDPGILAYMPQIWTSDNSDAITRLRIQYGTSLVYPFSTMAAHVSAVPNHQVGRNTPFRTRGDIAFTGAFGYELDLAALPADEKAEVKRQTAFYKQIRPLLLTGDLYRLKNPFESQEAAWMIVAADASQALVTHVSVLSEPNAPHRYLKLRGLDPKKNYRVRLDEIETVMAGDVLLHSGLHVPGASADFISHQWHLIAV